MFEPPTSDPMMIIDGSSGWIMPLYQHGSSGATVVVDMTPTRLAGELLSVLELVVVCAVVCAVVMLPSAVAAMVAEMVAVAAGVVLLLLLQRMSTRSGST